MTTETLVTSGSTRRPAAVRADARRRSVYRRRTALGALARHVFLIVVSVLLIYPLLWMIVSSLRPNDEIFRLPGLWPVSFDTSNYIDGWNALSPSFGTYLVNSVIVVLGSIIGNLVSCAMAAYAFARLDFRFKRTMFAIMLVTIMLPMHVVIVPQYIMFSQMGLVNTFWPLILPKMLATDSFFIFLMVQFIRGIPRELDEAARIDGAGHARIFLQILIPMMTPALATTAIFTFVWVWNDFFGALIYLNNPQLFTVPLALRQFLSSQGSSNFGGMFAMSVVSLVPVFLAFLFGQRFLIKGIATTGMK
ncbi:carbohydrate ABC transporter permease [Microbacterium sp. NEAU-LLC]|uniref:Carbohydrate ABC transporter permease n=1 Tax=Microbacterium helvum TaxID=2773713 RepID=A0ABR8NIR0_9MICO|nr:carbohydrate ABC transporter permease [Microbacterium helvum]MBD3940578.1 carbohydrate ABC transporter permease [Microbacterium helvum]